MAVEPLKELKYPEWEQQEGEDNKHYFFGRLFFNCNDTVEEFHDRMHAEYVRNGTDGFLLYVPYSLNYFYDLFNSRFWRDRRNLKQSHDMNVLFDELDKIENERKIERFQLKENIEYEALDKLEEKVKYDNKLTGGQFKDFTQGIRNLQDSRNIDREKPTDYSKQQVESEVVAGVKTNLNIEDNHALSTVQAMFMQPEFVELNKKLMDKTADELQKQRNSNE